MKIMDLLKPRRPRQTARRPIRTWRLGEPGTITSRV